MKTILFLLISVNLLGQGGARVVDRNNGFGGYADSAQNRSRLVETDLLIITSCDGEQIFSFETYYYEQRFVRKASLDSFRILRRYDHLIPVGGDYNPHDSIWYYSQREVANHIVANPDSFQIDTIKIKTKGVIYNRIWTNGRPRKSRMIIPTTDSIRTDLAGETQRYYYNIQQVQNTCITKNFMLHKEQKWTYKKLDKDYNYEKRNAGIKFYLPDGSSIRKINEPNN